MGHVSRRDVQRLIDVLPTIYAVCSIHSFPEQVIPEILKVLPSDFTTYRLLDSPTAISRSRVWPAGSHDPKHYEQAFGRHWREHPVLNHHLKSGDGQAVKVSDFVTQRQFRQLGIYQEVYRLVGVEDMLAMVLRVPVPGGIGVALHRDRPNFSELDREMAEMLRPHLTQAYINAKAFTEMRDALQLNGWILETLDQGVVTLKSNDQFEVATTKARRLLADYFGSVAGDRLADPLKRWVRSRAALVGSAKQIARPCGQLIIERGGRTLLVRLILEAEHKTLLLEERSVAASGESLEVLGLTRREAQVLAWVGEGKTNAEIGTILDARPRTVAKHLERIFQKLGVETRTAAAKVALTAAM